MPEISLSKKGWISVVGTVLLLPVLGGFLSAFGEELYHFSRSMIVDSQFQYVILPIIILIGIGIVIGVVLIVFDIYKQKRKLPKGAVHPTFSGIETDPDRMDPESRRRREDDWRFFPSNVR